MSETEYRMKLWSDTFGPFIPIFVPWSASYQVIKRNNAAYKAFEETMNKKMRGD